MKLTKQRLKEMIKEQLGALGQPEQNKEETELDQPGRSKEEAKRLVQEAATSVRTTVQKALMMDEARPGEDEWLEKEVSDVLIPILEEYLRKWRGRK